LQSSLRVGLVASLSDATGGPDRFLSNAAAISESSPRSVPAPLIRHGLLALLGVGGVLLGNKLPESLKKRTLRVA
jgi:hypothetical protein